MSYYTYHDYWNKSKCNPCKKEDCQKCKIIIKYEPGATGPTGPTPSRPTRNIYVVNNADDTVSVIDGDTNTVITTIPVGNPPFEAAIDTNNNLIYVTNANDNTVSVIDGATNTVIDTIPVGANLLCS